MFVKLKEITDFKNLIMLNTLKKQKGGLKSLQKNAIELFCEYTKRRTIFAIKAQS